jgi:gamma-glutamylcyclotransferase (GGCT)/AIG2-like uncharacterized protein YtfP
MTTEKEWIALGGGTAGDVPDQPVEPGEELLFVYGTLRRGECSEQLLKGCRWGGLADIRGIMHDFGDFPAVVLEKNGTVHGEIWACPPETLLALDSYEEVETGLFDRRRIPLGGESVWVYVAGPRLRDAMQSARPIKAGRWPHRGTTSQGSREQGCCD